MKAAVYYQPGGLSGEFLSAGDALALGYVSAVVEPAAVVQAACAEARRMSSPPSSSDGKPALPVAKYQEEPSTRAISLNVIRSVRCHSVDTAEGGHDG